MLRSANPFSTRSIVPGAIRYLFLDPTHEALVVERVLDPSLPRIAIVGPHGTGKSTLLVQLMRLESVSTRYPKVGLLRVSANASKWQAWREVCSLLQPNSLVIIDGYEQIRFWQKTHLLMAAARVGCKLLISTHAPAVGFRTVWQTPMNAQVEAQVLRAMLGASSPIDPQLVMATEAWQASRARHGQNLRESLFDMYDWYRDTVDAQNGQR